MRLPLFLLASLFAHALVFAGWQLPIRIMPKLKQPSDSLHIMLAKNQVPPKIGLNAKKNTVANLEKTAVTPLNQTRNVSALATDQVNEQKIDEVTVPLTIVEPVVELEDTEASSLDTADYYSATQVDRKALPQINIDESMLASDYYSGLPVKLRLYIDTAGKLVKVEPIAVLDQDMEYVKQLEKLLFQLTFLPARKDGLDVDSYQDLQFSFNPLPIIDQSTGARE